MFASEHASQRLITGLAPTPSPTPLPELSLRDPKLFAFPQITMAVFLVFFFFLTFFDP